MYMESRNAFDEITGDESYSEEYVGNDADKVVTKDEFGRMVKSFTYADDDWPVDQWSEREYGESGRVITRRSYNSSAETDGDYTEYFDSIYTYEYDNNGRVAKCTLEQYHGGSEEIHAYSVITYSYENLEQGYYTSHENGTYIHESSIYEYDSDITIEQDGTLTYGEPYNYK